ncbi:uncharacterized protein LOC120081135 [Benincasa hispida]|uniref:uncharacterized protein LOC120081135 n=1 Tax=Benincasa hispida TaxID=102211 RepID=UPI0019014AC9|nr:uncharacterized protein LOC120081135 [Benincasa hispida]
MAAIKVRNEPSKTESKEQPVIESKKPLSQIESKESETMEPKDAITSKPPDHETLKVQLPPFPQRLKKKQNDEGLYYRFLEILKQLHINIPFMEAIEQMPMYVKFLKDIVSKKRSTGRFTTVALTVESNTIIPLKMRDLGSFTIPFSIGGIYIGKVLCDLGASINSLPLLIFKILNVGQLTPTTVTLQLADRSLVHPKGKLKDVLVTIDRFILPANFIILDYEADKDIPIILGQPFLSTGRAQIDVHKGVTMSINGKKLRFNIIKESEEENEEREDATTSTETCHAITEILKNEEMLNLDEERKAQKPSLEQPPTLELKTLPTHLKYVFLGQNKTLPVIISSVFPEEKETALLSVLKKYIRAIEWTLADIKDYGQTYEIYLQNLERILKRCEETNLVLKWEKCHFMVKEGIVLGHNVSKNGLEVDKVKIEAIEKLPSPANVKALRSFLRHVGFYRRFVKDFSKIAQPLNVLLEANRPFDFDSHCLTAFKTLKDALTIAPILITPDWAKPFELMCDSRGYAMRAVLEKKVKTMLHPIAYASRTLNSTQANYTTTEKELLAIIFAVEKFRPYLLGSKVSPHRPSAIRYLMTKKYAKPRLIC